MTIILRRILAFFIDFLLLAAYAGLLFFFVSPVVQPWFTSSAQQAELVGFLLLTLPFVLYFVVSEASAWSGSLGKCLLSLRVLDNNNKKKISISQSLKRSILKFLPWELAHFAIWNAFIFESSLSGMAIGALALCYALAILYAIGLLRKPHRPFYDRIADTVVVMK